MKNYQQIKDEVIKIISDTLNISHMEISEKSSISDLSEDSIHLFGLLIAFEKTYGIETTYEDIVRLHSVGDIVEYVQRVKFTA